MSVSRETFEVIEQVTQQREWARPVVARLSAGSAENGGTTNTDIGVSTS